MPNPQWIVVHGTGNDASAANEIANMTNNNSRGLDRNGNFVGWGVSFHFAVDDREIIQGLPLNRAGFHSGDSRNSDNTHNINGGNRAGIAIEICFDRSGGARYQAAESNAVQLVAQLLRERGWGIDRVRSHTDFTRNSGCPRQILRSQAGWQGFLNRVRVALNPAPTPRPPATSQTPQQPKQNVTLESVARRVINGEFGNNPQRRKRLTAAGFNAANVQKAVNALLARPPRPVPNLPLFVNSQATTSQQPSNNKTTQSNRSTLDELARQVMRGDWGNGAERVRRLTAEGHDVRAVQNRVNEMIRSGQ